MFVACSAFGRSRKKGLQDSGYALSVSPLRQISPGDQFQRKTKAALINNLLVWLGSISPPPWISVDQGGSVSASSKCCLASQNLKNVSALFAKPTALAYFPPLLLLLCLCVCVCVRWRVFSSSQKIIVPEDSSRHIIFADKLRSDSTYEASVRYGLKLWGETWSEWSATCEWLNGECAEGHFCSGEATCLSGSQGRTTLGHSGWKRRNFLGVFCVAAILNGAPIINTSAVTSEGKVSKYFQLSIL